MEASIYAGIVSTPSLNSQLSNLGLQFCERILWAALAAPANIPATVGLYGILAYNVTQRTREIALRRARGADDGRVRWVVLGKSGG